MLTRNLLYNNVLHECNKIYRGYRVCLSIVPWLKGSPIVAVEVNHKLGLHAGCIMIKPSHLPAGGACSDPIAKRILLELGSLLFEPSSSLVNSGLLPPVEAVTHCKQL